MCNFRGYAIDTIPLMDRMYRNNGHIPSRLYIPAIKDHFSERSFDHPYTRPWAKLVISNPSGNLTIGQKYTWSHLKTTSQEVVTQEQLTDNALLLS